MYQICVEYLSFIVFYFISVLHIGHGTVHWVEVSFFLEKSDFGIGTGAKFLDRGAEKNHVHFYGVYT